MNMVGVAVTPFCCAAAVIEDTQSACALLVTQVVNAAEGDSADLGCQIDQLLIAPLQRVVGEQPEVVGLPETCFSRARHCVRGSHRALVDEGQWIQLHASRPTLLSLL